MTPPIPPPGPSADANPSLAPRDATPLRATCTAIVGLQWGDEGKGKFVDLLAADHDAVARYNGGANAGHSVVVGGERYALHLVPSGILYPGKAAVIGNGVVVDPWKLVEEIDGLRKRGVDTSGLALSSRAHVVMPYHKLEDGLREDMLRQARAAREAEGLDDSDGGTSEIGTTRRGIGPAYAEKAQRALAIRVGDMLRPGVLREKIAVALSIKGPMLRALMPDQSGAAEISLEETIAGTEAVGRRLAPMVRDTTVFLNGLIAQGGKVLFEGANGTLLDVDHGTYPFVTASSVIAAGIGTGTGVPPWRVGRVLGIMKAYSTRVGAGPLPTELLDERGERIRQRGREFGTTTGRPRRVGWLDLVAVRYACMINGVTGLAVTLLDVLSGMDEIKVCTSYTIDGEATTDFTPDAYDLARAEPSWTTLPGFSDEIATTRSLRELPAPARRYLDFITETVGVPIDMVSVGPDRAQTIVA